MSISALGRLKNDNLSKLLPGGGSISLSLSSSRSLLSSNAKKNLTRSSLYSRPTFFSQSLDGLVQVVVQKSWKGFAFLSSPGQFLLLSLLAGLLKQLKTNWNLWKCFQANVNVLIFSGLWKICIIHRIERLHTSSRVMKHLTRIGVRHPPQERPFKLLICCSS